MIAKLPVWKTTDLATIAKRPLEKTPDLAMIAKLAIWTTPDLATIAELPVWKNPVWQGLPHTLKCLGRQRHFDLSIYLTS